MCDICITFITIFSYLEFPSSWIINTFKFDSGLDKHYEFKLITAAADYSIYIRFILLHAFIIDWEHTSRWILWCMFPASPE